MIILFWKKPMNQIQGFTAGNRTDKSINIRSHRDPLSTGITDALELVSGGQLSCYSGNWMCQC